MIRYARFLNGCISRLNIMYNKRLFYERTKQDVSTAIFMGKVEVRNPNIKIGKNVAFRGHIIFDGSGEIIIGNDVSINHGTIIHATRGGGVTIGDKTAIAAYTYIIDMNHSTLPGDNFHIYPDTFKEIIIGKNVWIAQNCSILKGSIIGDNSVCAAKTVITGKKIPANAIVAGVPGRVIKYKE